MKLKEYLKLFKGIDRNLEVIYAVDEEGNTFEPVFYAPTKGYFNEKEFIANPCTSDEPINAVCIN